MWVSVQWKTTGLNWWIYTSHIHWVTWGTGTPKDRDEVNRREFCSCDGWVCDLEAIGVPSMFKLIRSTTDLVTMLSTLDLRGEENTTRRKWKLVCGIWTCEVARKRSVSCWWESKKRRHTNSPLNIVLDIVSNWHCFKYFVMNRQINESQMEYIFRLLWIDKAKAK